MANEVKEKFDVLKQRLARAELQAYLWGTGNPETISYNVMTAMREDPYIKMGLNFIKMNVLGSEFILEGENEKMKVFVDKYFVRRYLTQVLSNALLGIDYGFSVQEKVYIKEDGWLVPAAFVSLEPAKCTLKVDSDTGVYSGTQYYGLAGSAFIPNFKTWCFSFQEEWGNLYGKSLLKGSYRPWYDENIMNLTLLRHLEFNGSGIAVMYFPGDLDENDKAKYQGQAETIVSSLRYKKEVTLPSVIDPESKEQMWKLDVVSGEVKGEGFVKAIDMANQKKLLGILIPPQLMVRNENTGSYAEASVKLDVAVMLIEGLAQALVEGVNKHVIRQLIDLNFPGSKDEVQLKLQPMSKDRQNFIRTAVAKILETSVSQRVAEEANKYMLDQFGVKQTVEQTQGA